MRLAAMATRKGLMALLQERLLPGSMYANCVYHFHNCWGRELLGDRGVTPVMTEKANAVGSSDEY